MAQIGHEHRAAPKDGPSASFAIGATPGTVPADSGWCSVSRILSVLQRDRKPAGVGKIASALVDGKSARLTGHSYKELRAQLRLMRQDQRLGCDVQGRWSLPLSPGNNKPPRAERHDKSLPSSPGNNKPPRAERHDKSLPSSPGNNKPPRAERHDNIHELGPPAPLPPKVPIADASAAGIAAPAQTETEQAFTPRSRARAILRVDSQRPRSSARRVDPERPHSST